MTLSQQFTPSLRPRADESRGVRTDGVNAETDQLFALLHDPASSAGDRERARERIVRLHLATATTLARRFAGRGEPLDDLVQVACSGLVKAVNGYDPARGIPFICYARPTMLGELKRHFRDHGWDLRVPRRVQETHLALIRARVELTQQLQRSPTTAELAQRLDLGEPELREAIGAGQVYHTDSLSQPVSADEGSRQRQDLLGDCDPALERVCDRIAIEGALRRLPQRERDIVTWYYFGSQTQVEIAEHAGISQMHVSRLLTQALTRLRRWIRDDSEPARSVPASPWSTCPPPATTRPGGWVSPIGTPGRRHPPTSRPHTAPAPPPTGTPPRIRLLPPTKAVGGADHVGHPRSAIRSDPADVVSRRKRLARIPDSRGREHRGHDDRDP